MANICTNLKAHEISRQNMRNSENIGHIVLRGGSRAAATSKIERFVIIVNGCKPLTIITKRSILDVAAVLDPPLVLGTVR